MRKKETLISYLILLGFILIMIGYHVFGYIGHYGVDDMLYARLASDWNNGIVDYETHFAYRVPVVLLTAMMYKLFGINDFASSLPALLLTSGVLYMVFKALENKGRVMLTLGLAFTLLCDWFIFYSDKLMADVYVTFAIFGALFVIQHYRYQYSKKESPIKHAIGLALFLLFGFTSKGTIILFLPALLFLFFYDLNKGIYAKFWKAASLSTVLVFGVYFLLTYIITGSVLSRFEAIAKNGYLNLCSYDQQSVIFLIDRVTYEFLELMFSKGMAVGYLLIAGYLIQKKSLVVIKMEDQFSFFLVMSVVLLLSCNFMTISLEHYVPMCLDPRHFLFLVPVVAIPSAYILNDFFKTRQLRLQMVAVMLIGAIYTFEINEDAYWYLYMPMFLLVALVALVPPRINFTWVAVAITTVILGLLPLKMISYASDVNYEEQKRVAMKYFSNHEENSYVITSDVQRSLCEYYNGFNKQSKQIFLAYGEFDDDTLRNKDIYIYKNWYTRYLSGQEERELPFYARVASLTGDSIYGDELTHTSIYKLKELDNPDQEVFSTKNDFETARVRYWVTGKKDITKRFVYNGEGSHVVDVYSSTLELPLDRIDLSNAKTILFTSNVKAHFNKATNAKMVLELVNEEGGYYWESMEVNHFIKAYNNWWPIRYEVFLSGDKIKPNSKLKVYMLSLINI